METQKIINLLNGSDNENSKFATKKWNIIDSETKGIYSPSIASSDYSDSYILVTGNIRVTRRNNNTKAAFKNCAPFKDCRTEINDTFVDYADFINITMPMHNLIEYSNNCSNTSGSLWQFKRDEIEGNVDLIIDNSSSFKCKSNIIGDLSVTRTKKDVKIVVPLKYLSNFWRSLEMPQINFKIEFLLKWYENCILSTAGNNAAFTITDTKLYELLLYHQKTM